MNNPTCTTVEPLLPLYRDGELLPHEAAMVTAHLEHCARCSAIAREFGMIDGALSDLRSANVETAPRMDIVGATMARLSTQEQFPRRQRATPDPGLRILIYIQRSLSVALASLILLFIIQQTRDSVDLVRMEDRLRAEGVSASPLPFNGIESARAGLGALQRDENRGELFRKPSEAAMPAIPFMELFSRQENAIEQLAARYPRLQSVRLEDGIDEREREILATDGMNFLNDVQQLVAQGARKP